MKSSSKDKVKGTVSEARGKVMKTAGQATGDPNMEAKGAAGEGAGKLRKKVGDVKKVFGK